VGSALKWPQAHLALEADMSPKGIVFVVVLFVLVLGAVVVHRPTTKPAHWTVVEVRYLKNGDCAFVAEWSAGMFSVPEYVKAESKDSVHSLCPDLGEILNPPRFDLMTISAGAGEAQRFADVIEQWRGQDVNPR
jgi:hypothetical protein